MEPLFISTRQPKSVVWTTIDMNQNKHYKYFNNGYVLILEEGNITLEKMTNEQRNELKKKLEEREKDLQMLKEYDEFFTQNLEKWYT